ncbi:MAG TPA: enoyl-CoA hydratase/isomerase family protein [Acidimicrobiales bacterium]
MDIDWMDRTAVVRLGDGPNAFDTAFVEDLHARLDDVAADDSAQALVTVGGGRHYSNGFDIEFLGSLDGPGLSTFMDRALGLLARLLTFPVPTVAAVNGHAFGIGAMLALAHDRRVVRADRGWWCLPEIDLGMQFHPFMLALVTHRLPAATAEEAVLTGRRYDAAAAVERGVAHGAAAVDDLVAAAAGQALPLAGKGRDIAVALKQALHAPVLAHLGG